jgi:RNA polymerase sigma factor (sigma-70 family)
LQDLVADLSPDDRTLVSLKYQEGLKYAQISQRTGLSVSHVGYKLHHALKNLAEALRRRGIESADG